MDIQTCKRIAALCDVGYSSGDVGYYRTIDAILAGEEQTDGIAAVRRLAQSGHTLSSPRFAFPHIKDRVLDMAPL